MKSDNGVRAYLAEGGLIYWREGLFSRGRAHLQEDRLFTGTRKKVSIFRGLTELL